MATSNRASSPTGSAATIAAAAAAVADPTRAAFLELLMDGRAWTVSELARAVGVAASTATEHGHRLVSAGWCDEVRQGRHRYLRLSGPEVAALLESLGAIRPDPMTAPKPTSLRSSRQVNALRAGRTCYGHLAGALGVEISDQWIATGIVANGDLTQSGRDWLTHLGVDTTSHPRRRSIRTCLDWTERRDHLGGVIPERFCALLLQREWLAPREGRAVQLTPAGHQALGL